MNVKDNWFTLFNKLTKVLKSKIQNILLPFPTVFYPPETSRFVVLNNYYAPWQTILGFSSLVLLQPPSYLYFPHMPLDTGAH